MTYRRAIKEETIALNHDWVYNQACRLLHDIYVASHKHISPLLIIKLVQNSKMYMLSVDQAFVKAYIQINLS